MTDEEAARFLRIAKDWGFVDFEIKDAPHLPIGTFVPVKDPPREKDEFGVPCPQPYYMTVLRGTKAT